MSHNNPVISVIIPCYNSEQYIAETIGSVINQTYKYWELIIVDDGSTDSSREIITEYSLYHKNIIPLRRDRAPKGGNTCRNIGLSVAKGEYVIFLDADDLLAPWCLEQRATTMAYYPGLDFGVFKMIKLNNPGNSKQSNSFKSTGNPLKHFIALENIWQITSPVWNKKFLLSINGFNENYNRLQDVELAFRALTIKNVSYKIFNEKTADCYYRQGIKILDKKFWQAGYQAVGQYITDVLMWLESTDQLMQYTKNLNRSAYNYIIYWWRSGQKEINPTLIPDLYNKKVINMFDYILFRITILSGKLGLNQMRFIKLNIEFVLRTIKVMKAKAISL